MLTMHCLTVGYNKKYFTSRIALAVGGMWVVWLEDWAPELHIPGRPAPSSLIRTIYRVALEQTLRQAGLLASPPSQEMFFCFSLFCILIILIINEFCPCKAVPCQPGVGWRRNVAFWTILPHIWKLILKRKKTAGLTIMTRSQIISKHTTFKLRGDTTVTKCVLIRLKFLLRIPVRDRS